MAESDRILCDFIESDRAYLDSHLWFKDKSIAVILHDRFTRERRLYMKHDGIWQFEGIKTTQEIYGKKNIE